MKLRFCKIIGITVLLFMVYNTVRAQHANPIFRKETLNAGTILLGDTVFLQYELKNMGKQPLIIHKLETTCGCTVAKKPEKPVMPKQKAVILVRYVAEETGRFSRTITVYCNAKHSPIYLYLNGKVK